MKKKVKVSGVLEIRHWNWALLWHGNSWQTRRHWPSIEWGVSKPKGWKDPVWKTWRYRSLELRKYYWRDFGDKEIFLA